MGFWTHQSKLLKKAQKPKQKELQIVTVGKSSILLDHIVVWNAFSCSFLRGCAVWRNSSASRMKDKGGPKFLDSRAEHTTLKNQRLIYSIQ
jgi:hypothetical protein